MEYGELSSWTQPETTLTCKTTCNTGLTWEDGDDRVRLRKPGDAYAG